jgi:hypothetical protein
VNSGASLPICTHITGTLARIAKYVRQNGKCPAREFLDGIEQKMRKRFEGQFDALTKIGAEYINGQRFTPLRGQGKPLWEFKEHDHRIYCFRRVVPPNKVDIILFSGWIKQKSGKTNKEGREIERAQLIMEEFLKEYEGGYI